MLINSLEYVNESEMCRNKSIWQPSVLTKLNMKQDEEEEEEEEQQQYRIQQAEQVKCCRNVVVVAVVALVATSFAKNLQIK